MTSGQWYITSRAAPGEEASRRSSSAALFHLLLTLPFPVSTDLWPQPRHGTGTLVPLWDDFMRWGPSRLSTWNQGVWHCNLPRTPELIISGAFPGTWYPRLEEGPQGHTWLSYPLCRPSSLAPTSTSKYTSLLDDPVRDVGREVGGGFRMGNTCTPMADSCQCMAKPLQYCKGISLQLKNNKLIFKKLFKNNICVWKKRYSRECGQTTISLWTSHAPGATSQSW